MEFSARAIVLISVLSSGVIADNFNYGYTSGDNYGPAEWNLVECNDLETCSGWPDKHESSIGWELEENQCKWCPETGNKCPFNHRMSPVNLVRDRAIEDNPNWKDCPDWHWMNFEDGTCKWDDMEDSFEINEHALQIHTPMRGNGDINCANSEGERLYPRLDYSKGFPDWWHLDRTDVKVPSEHTQHGKRYAAEISLAHFYELDHWKNQVGYVTLFMQDYPNEKPWHYLDKLICQWRREEEKQREKCGLPPAPVYKMCELYRGQERTSEDLEFSEETDNSSENPILATNQVDRPNPIPIEDFGGNPDGKHFPLQLCQGDCDFTEDCAPGLICHRREANEAVPGCIGGEENSDRSDFCVFDPFGQGYNVQTSDPTGSPTETLNPTITPLPPKPAVDFGGTPPASSFPLQRCQGDCDRDSDCAEGLICFQRNSKQSIPGCIGGEAIAMMTDYCILNLRGDGYTDLETMTPTIKPTALATSTPTISKDATKPPTNIPTSVPTQKAQVPLVPRPTGTQKEIWNRGWEPNFLLGECEGDCDNNDDCISGLVCFSRETANVDVPGCLGGEEDSTLTDYCTYPPFVTNDENSAVIRKVDTTPPTDPPSGPPTKSPTEPPMNTINDEPVPLNSISWSPSQLLGVCEGDCDVDEDCETGLVCFERYTPNTPVPGCIGGDSDTSLMDYCVIGRSSDNTTPAVTLATVPVPAPAPAPAPVPAPVPIFAPVPQSQSITRDGVPPSIECQKYADMGVNFNRFCDNDHQDMCCKSPRSDSNYCHKNYGIFGYEMHSACHHCCLETRNEAHFVGEPNEVKEGLEPYTNEECSQLDNSARVCKAESCCEPEFADTQYCRQQIASNKGEWERICWSCCHPSKEFPLDTARRFLTETSADVAHASATMAKTEDELRLWHRENPRDLGPKDVKFNHTTMHRELIVREENFVEKGLKDEDAYFEEIHSAFQRRELQTPMLENYEDVHWWPYEWLLKVGTEYYYRYEGSMTVPPCYSVNHWRVMKDPIRVAKHQITELERLLAWRINGKCKPSTAGKERKNNPDAVDVNRPLQELQKGHRMVFCECQDWPSKFPQERNWCDKWQKKNPEERLFENPYNWDQIGF